MLRAFHPYPLSNDAPGLQLDGAESRHLRKSLRAREGEALEVFDGKGRIRRCTVGESDAFGMRVTVNDTFVAPKPRVTLTLAQVLPKGGLFDDLIRTAVELGAGKIIPLLSERCEVKLDADRAEAKSERWETLAVEALKQSGNPWLIELSPVRKLAKWLPEALGPGKTGLIASLEEGSTRVADFTAPEGLSEIIVLVGPEGDFSPAEYGYAKQAGFAPVRLGAHVLRAETAAAYGLVAADLIRQRAGGA